MKQLLLMGPVAKYALLAISIHLQNVISKSEVILIE